MSATLTLEEAADFLDPPVTVYQLRLLIVALGVEPAGARRTGRSGRPPLCYPAALLMQIHAAFVPLLAAGTSNSGKACLSKVPS